MGIKSMTFPAVENNPMMELRETEGLFEGGVPINMVPGACLYAHDGNG